MGTTTWRLRSCAVAVCAIVWSMLLLCAGLAAADNTVTVNTTLTNSTQGDGLCSLSEAIAYANGGADPDCSTAPRSGTTTIDLPAGKYQSSGFTLTNPTVIVGAGASLTDIDGGGANTVLSVSAPVSVTLRNLEISGGNSGFQTTGCMGSGASLNCPPEAGNPGGGISNLGALSLQNVSVIGNHAGDGTGVIGVHLCAVSCSGASGGAGGGGGGIYNAGTLTVDSSILQGNTAGNGGPGGNGVGVSANAGDGSFGGVGGAVYNYFGTATISHSTIVGNSAGTGGPGGNGVGAGNAGAGGQGGSGGAIAIVGGGLTITDSTLAGNRAGDGGALGMPGATGNAAAPPDGGAGGAIDYDSATPNGLVLIDDTLTRNAAGATPQQTAASHDGPGGAIAAASSGTLTNLTIVGNSGYAGGGIYALPGSTFTESNSIVASNTSSAGASPAVNCGGVALIDGGHNVVFGDNSCPGAVSDPKVQPLANNGGPTQTMRLGAGSAAIAWFRLEPAP